jgi:hypothetical protein
MKFAGYCLDKPTRVDDNPGLATPSPDCHQQLLKACSKNRPSGVSSKKTTFSRSMQALSF